MAETKKNSTAKSTSSKTSRAKKPQAATKPATPAVPEEIITTIQVLIQTPHF